MESGENKSYVPCLVSNNIAVTVNGILSSNIALVHQHMSVAAIEQQVAYSSMTSDLVAEAATWEPYFNGSDCCRGVESYTGPVRVPGGHKEGFSNPKQPEDGCLGFLVHRTQECWSDLAPKY